MQHEFVILEGKELKTYHNFEDIPMEFDNVISFKPCVPEGPHTDDQHNEIGSWNEKLQELMKREKR
jgi:hypothetical protein